MLLQPATTLDFKAILEQVSIPRAVGVVATFLGEKISGQFELCFNTASGRCCCNPSRSNYTRYSRVRFQYRER